jgi:hypothetical protein
MLIVGLLFTGAAASVVALAYAQAPGKPRPLILARDEGDLAGMWMVSPPHFAETLREGAADASDAGKGSAADLDEIGGTHGYRDSRHWFLPGFARIAATLALGAVFIPLLSRVRPFRAAAFYALGATIATIVTLLALAMGSLSSIVIASALLIAVGIFMATLGGIGFRALASRLASRSS